jgi:glucosamine--fructose-6-phosphate aminotransferase (isomerizing)
MKRCTRCVTPNTYPGISFDSKGVCNYCLAFGADTPRGEDELHSIIRQYQGQGERFDCLVALSGGRDSSYALYYVTQVLGLRTLAFTIDNGFMPQETRQNIQNAVSILGVDHVIAKHNSLRRNIRPALSAWLHRPSPAMIPILCTGCRMALYRGFLRTARQYKIPLLISGQGEPETSFATKFFSGSTSAKPRAATLVLGMGRELEKNPRYLMNPTFPYDMFMEYLYAFSPIPIMQKLICPEMRHVRLFEFIPWDEKEIMTVIQNKLEWRNYAYSRSPWRSDCKINLLRNHLYIETLGFTKNEELVSNLIRLGKISRDEGLARVEYESVISEQFLREFFEEIRLPFKAYESSLPKIHALSDRLAAT